MIDVGNSLCIHANVNCAIIYKLIGLASFCLDIQNKYKLAIILMSNLIGLCCKQFIKWVLAIVFYTNLFPKATLLK